MEVTGEVLSCQKYEGYLDIVGKKPDSGYSIE